jgi:glycosyltransferase involved in cell wall biosynthesis
MKICLVTQQLRNVFSGVGLYSKNILNYLSRENHDIIVIVPENQIPSGEQFYQITTVKSTKLLKSQARWIHYSWQFNKTLKLLEKKECFDVIHFTDARDSYFCKTKSPTVGNVNDTYSIELHPLKYFKENYFDWFQRYLYYNFVHFIERKNLVNLHTVIANSNFTCQTIKNQYEVQESKIHICHKSVDFSRYKDVRSSRKPEDNQHKANILFVGGNMQRKGLIDLIRAASILKEDFPNFHINVAGRDRFIPKYQQLCEKNNVSNNFDFLGWVSQDQLLSLYQKSTVFVLPSLTEALGVVFLEAMAAGVPVIGTKVGGIPEIIVNEQNGLLVPVRSPECISESIKRLANNPDLRNHLVNNGFKTVREFSIEKMMDCTKRVYQNIIRGE